MHQSIVEAKTPFVGRLFSGKLDIRATALIAKSINPIMSAIGIYFLIKDDEIVYVGRSIDLHSRVSSHKKTGEVDFDTYNWIGCERSELIDLHAGYMLKFNPEANKDLPPCGRFISIGVLRSKGLGKRKFKSYINKTEHCKYRFSDYTYYDLNALALDQVFLDLLTSEGISHWWHSAKNNNCQE